MWGVGEKGGEEKLGCVLRVDDGVCLRCSV